MEVGEWSPACLWQIWSELRKVTLLPCNHLQACCNRFLNEDDDAEVEDDNDDDDVMAEFSGTCGPGEGICDVEIGITTHAGEDEELEVGEEELQELEVGDDG